MVPMFLEIKTYLLVVIELLLRKFRYSFPIQCLPYQMCKFIWRNSPADAFYEKAQFGTGQLFTVLSSCSSCCISEMLSWFAATLHQNRGKEKRDCRLLRLVCMSVCQRNLYEKVG